MRLRHPTRQILLCLAWQAIIITNIVVNGFTTRKMPVARFLLPNYQAMKAMRHSRLTLRTKDLILTRLLPCMHMTSNDSDFASKDLEKQIYFNPDEPGSEQTEPPNTNKILILGYRFSAIIYAAMGVNAFASTAQLHMLPLVLNVASGPFLAAGVADILSKATLSPTKSHTFNTDNTQRLNLAFSLFGFLWILAAGIGYATQSAYQAATLASHPVVMLASISAMITGIQGYNAFVSNETNVFQTISSSLRPLTLPTPNLITNFLKGITLLAVYMAGYLNITILKGAILTSREAIGGKLSVEAALVALAMATAKLVLLGTSTLSLLATATTKDCNDDNDTNNRRFPHIASKRKGTFIKLCLVSSFGWLGTGAYFLASGAAAASLFAKPIAILAPLASAILLVTGIMAVFN